VKILLAQNMIYVPSIGGANTTTRLLMKGLANCGHECRMVVVALGGHGPQTRAEFLDALTVRGISPTYSSDIADVFHDNGVCVHAVRDALRLRAYLSEQIRDFDPTWVIIPSQDPGQVLLEAAVRQSPGNSIYLVMNPWDLPFGPGALYRSAASVELVRQTAGVITVSRFLQDYIRRWSGLDSVVAHFPVYGSEPFPYLGAYDNKFVTMINPSLIKGIVIFLALAEKFPDVKFAAVPTWATSAADLDALSRLANVTLLDPVDDINEIFAQTRVLLMPSMYNEAFGNIVVEAMLRGIPALASNDGGVPEAKLGVDYVLPVRTFEGFEPRFNERNCPVPIIPEQDLAPWENALRDILTDRGRYERLSIESREAARRFVKEIEKIPWDAFLLNLVPQARWNRHDSQREMAEDQPQTKISLDTDGSRSSDERALLAVRALKLKKKG
jgi:glycosyltransferase involved in cell wall biosynthesis